MSNSSRSHSQGVPRQRSARAAWRDELYVIIFEADTRAGQIFDVALLICILLSITVVSLETVESCKLQPQCLRLLRSTEWVLTLLFTAEYVARLIAVRNPLRYAISFWGVIDLLACVPLYLTLASVDTQSLMVVRSVRLLRVFRVLKMMRMLREARALREAIWNARDKILVFLATVLVAVTISGTLMYQVEYGVEGKASQFTSIPQSMYWAIVTMTTVGYGDVVPHTAMGKSISALLILLGYSLIIVPTGFISAEIHAQKRLHNYNSRTCPNCFREGHSPEANFCDICGRPLAMPAPDVP
ncbi:MAG: ion transporter [Planctomycetales bacterium]|nr:ion transporter [Planctomycetales bacterium]